MLPAEKPEMVRILAGLATIKPGAKLTPEAYEVWWMAMQHWPLDEFKAAAAHLARTSEFMPSPYHFEQLRKANRPTSGEAFAEAVQHAASGAWRAGGTGDPLIDQAVRALGGFRVIAMCEEDKLPFLERRFAEHFESITDAEVVRYSLPDLTPDRPAIPGPQGIVGVMARIGRSRTDA
jgi:hypothetical protein